MPTPQYSRLAQSENIQLESAYDDSDDDENNLNLDDVEIAFFDDDTRSICNRLVLLLFM